MSDRVDRMPVPVGETRTTSVDDVLIGLKSPVMLELLGVTEDDLERARSDTDLLETLRIVHDVLARLQDAEVLGAFLALSKTDQANFMRVLGATDDPARRAHRCETFITALKESPLGQLFSADRRPTDESSAGMASDRSNL